MPRTNTPSILCHLLHHGLRLCVLFLSMSIAELSAAESATGAEIRPNIVLIISDDQTYTDFGFMGNDQVQTPHLDRLADQSARYVNGYVPSSVCRPSLVTLLTGLYPHQHGIYFNHPPPGFSELTRSPQINKRQYDDLRERAARQIRNLPTLPRQLAQAGYRCLQTGKYWEGHWENAGFTDGMTTAQPSGGPHGDTTLANGEVVAHGNGDHGLIIGRQTMRPIFDFIDDCGDTPFFVWYAPFLPHTPHNSPPEFAAQYDDQPGLPRHRIPYYAAISQFDATVGQLVTYVDQHRPDSETLYLFVTDNGWEPDPERFHESTGKWEHTKNSKRSPFDAGLRTPVLLRWDGVIPPATHDGLVNSVDLVPTLLAVANVDSGALELPGVNLLPSATGQTPLDEDRTVFGELYPGDATALNSPDGDIAYRWVRRGRHKLIVPHQQHGQPPWNRYLTQPALFDVVADPSERQNLIGKPAHSMTAAELRRLLDDWWSPQP